MDGLMDTPPMRIFLVENHEDTLNALVSYLEQMGHTVFAARTVKEAMDLLPTADCDVLFSDIGLPDGTGWDLLENLTLPTLIYAIAISGYGTRADRERSEAVGFRSHLVKPCDPDEIDVLLEKAAQELGGRKN